MENDFKEKKVAIKISFLESVKFGVGLGAGLFLWFVFLVVASAFILDEFLSGMTAGGGGMMY